jgi:hypothetical protein
MEREDKFKIDFFEFAFLVEACIPPRPIARMSFWYKVIDEYYDILTKEERLRLFEWITKNHGFDLEQEDCALFYARFDPNNQYKVLTNYEGKEEVVDCFKWGDKYHIKRNRFIDEDYIVKENISINIK